MIAWVFGASHAMAAYTTMSAARAISARPNTIWLGSAMSVRIDSEERERERGDVSRARKARSDGRDKIIPGVVDAEIGAMQRAPCHKRPGRAVPEATEQHRDHQIDVAPHTAVPVAAERDVEIVAQELRQRHVPAPPEIDDR